MWLTRWVAHTTAFLCAFLNIGAITRLRSHGASKLAPQAPASWHFNKLISLRIVVSNLTVLKRSVPQHYYTPLLPPLPLPLSLSQQTSVQWLHPEMRFKTDSEMIQHYSSIFTSVFHAINKTLLLLHKHGNVLFSLACHQGRPYTKFMILRQMLKKCRGIRWLTRWVAHTTAFLGAFLKIEAISRVRSHSASKLAPQVPANWHLSKLTSLRTILSNLTVLKRRLRLPLQPPLPLPLSLPLQTSVQWHRH